jgi:hypothetical protein
MLLNLLAMLAFASPEHAMTADRCQIDCSRSFLQAAEHENGARILSVSDKKTTSKIIFERQVDGVYREVETASLGDRIRIISFEPGTEPIKLVPLETGPIRIEVTLHRRGDRYISETFTLVPLE